MPTPSNPLKAVRGTRDILPPETALWNRVESIARSVFSRYGFGEIRTPIFEDTSLFARGVGEETDIVNKEMYTWEDGERFEKKKLSDSWLAKNMSRVISFTVLQGDPFDMRFEPLTGPTELVAFSGRPDEVIWKAIEGARMLPNEHSVLKRLVVPSPIPDKPEDHISPEFVIEHVFGSFTKSSQNLTLRPENTAGVVRAYIEHNLGDTGQLQKLYYIGPQFRRERPQRGRYRQFWQIGAEVLGPVTSGSESPLRDAEVLEMLATLLDELGVKNWQLALNSVGSATEQRVLRAEASVRELERGARVVVEAADETGAQGVGDACSIEGSGNGREMFLRFFVERVADFWQRVDDGLILRNFAAEHAQRIGDGPALAVDTHFWRHFDERGTKHFVVTGTVGGRPNGVELEGPAGDAQFVE